MKREMNRETKHETNREMNRETKREMNRDRSALLITGYRLATTNHVK
jgi:hypothetical protein